MTVDVSLINNYTHRADTAIKVGDLSNKSEAVKRSMEDSLCNIAFKKIIKNPFFWALSLIAGAIIVIAFSAVILSPLSFLGVTTLVFSILGIAYLVQNKKMKKWLFCEFSLLMTTLATTFLSELARRPWYSKITDHITLGANPLKTWNHLELLKKGGHTAVLSLIEPFESEPHLCGTPVTEEDWVREGLIYLNLPNPDLMPVNPTDVVKGVEFLHDMISKGRKVYVHCNAGVGRSATIVICYLIKYHGMTAKEAVDFVHSRRTIVTEASNPSVSAFVQQNVLATV